jgi:hypothetical protein
VICSVKDIHSAVLQVSVCAMSAGCYNTACDLQHVKLTSHSHALQTIILPSNRTDRNRVFDVKRTCNEVLPLCLFHHEAACAHY